MQIDSTFSVVAPIDTVWDTLMDFERVAGCLPGAKILNKLSDDAYQVGMTREARPGHDAVQGPAERHRTQRGRNTVPCSAARPRRPADRAPPRPP